MYKPFQEKPVILSRTTSYKQKEKKKKEEESGRGIGKGQ